MDSPLFRLGELAQVAHSPGVAPDWRGAVVEIASLLGQHKRCQWTTGHSPDCYIIQHETLGELCAIPQVLLKLPPPDPSATDVNQKRTWSDGVWKPKSVKESNSTD